MMLIAQGVAGLGKAGYGAWQKKQGKQALAGAYEAPTGKPSEYADLIKQARASDLSRRRLDEINRSMASSTAALQQGGSRALIGGIGQVTGAGSAAKTQALSQQQQEIMRAMTIATSGAERQRQRDVARQNREEGFAMNAIQAGAQNITGGIGDVMQAGLNYGVASKEGLLGEDELEPVVNALTAEKGAKVKKTPGKFSHKENPINLMKDGAKIGEMTGGEYIFNPTQAKSMQKLAKSGDSDLHKFVRTLLNKPQFK